MENDNHTQTPEKNNYPFLRLVIGVLLMVSGVVDILVSLNLLEYVDTRPNRIAIFNDPHTWEVFALGATLLFFGIGNILPTRMKILGRINKYLLLISFAAVVIGVILEKVN